MEIDSILFDMQNAQFGSHGINDDGLAVGERECCEPPHDHKNRNDDRRPRALVEWQITNLPRGRKQSNQSPGQSKQQ